MGKQSVGKGLALALVVLGMAGQLWLAPKIHSIKVDQKKERIFTVSLPGKLVKLVALDFSGLISDVLFLDLAVFFGDPNKKIDPRFIDRVLELAENITLLDPRFQDPYYLAEAVVWESDPKRIDRINRLLERATRYRTWDGWFPFMQGFNHFFFRRDYHAAARSLKISSERPGVPRLAAGLATRMYQRSGSTLSAVLFLKEMLKREKDPERIEEFKLRLMAFYRLWVLEQAMDRFFAKYKRRPERLEELVSAGIIPAIPEDPYGGRFYIRKDGRVITDSGFFKSFEARKKKGSRRGKDGG